MENEVFRNLMLRCILVSFMLSVLALTFPDDWKRNYLSWSHNASERVDGWRYTLSLEGLTEKDYEEADFSELFGKYVEAYHADLPLDILSNYSYFEQFSNSVLRVVRLRQKATNGEEREQFGINEHAHLGLKGLFGDGYDSACNNAWLVTKLNEQMKACEDDSMNRHVIDISTRIQFRRHAKELTSRYFCDFPGERNLNMPETSWPNVTVEHKQCITPVRDQHPPFVSGCGSCWSHGAVGGLEIPLCVVKQQSTDAMRNLQIDFSYEDPSHMMSLSVQEIVDCTTTDNGKTTLTDPVHNHGCKGGSIFTTWNLLQESGLRSENVFPGQGDHYNHNSFVRCAEKRALLNPEIYPRWFPKLSLLSGNSDYRSTTIELHDDVKELRDLSSGRPLVPIQAPKFKLTGYTAYPNFTAFMWEQESNYGYHMWPSNLTQQQEWIKKGIREKGGVPASILTSHDRFYSWKNWSDIYYPNREECIGRFNATGSLAMLTNHLITIVGYGCDNGRKFFRVKNSWTTKFGDNGFYRVSANHCDQFEGPQGRGVYFKLPIVPVFEKI